MSQIEALESHINEHKQAEATISKGFSEVSNDIDDCLSHVLDDSQENWMEMEYLVGKQDMLVAEIQGKIDSASDFDKSVLETDLKALRNLFSKSERKVLVQKNEINTAKRNVKNLKAKVADLSKKVLSMSGLEIREKRLLRERTKLKEKFEEVKNKYENQRIVARKLENQLKTSFRAEEVQAIRDELKRSEDELKRVNTEKTFIEQHFISLEKDTSTNDDLIDRLDRACREIELLENTVMDMDKESKKNDD